MSNEAPPLPPAPAATPPAPAEPPESYLADRDGEAAGSRYRQLFEEATYGIALADAETGVIVDCNPAMLAMVERQRHEVVGHPQYLLHPPETRVGEFSDKFAEVRVYPGLSGLVRSQLLTAKGERREVEIKFSNLWMGGRRLLQGMFHDLTALLSAQEELSVTNHRLSEALKHQRQTQERLLRQERLSALGSMASGIAHDFNNQLTVIKGMTELLLLNHRRRQNDAELTHTLRMILLAAEDATKIVERLRDCYRDRQADEPHQELALSELVHQVVAFTEARWRQGSAGRRQAVRRRLLLNEDARVKGHAAELREVLTNLILNALDAMPNGGELTLATHLDDEGVRLVVSDTGCGMDAATLARIFDPFFTTKGHRGTGLGLPVTQGIVRRHGGTIDITSTPGQGSTFTITLPRPSQAPAATLDILAPTPVDADARRILVVDDEADLRNLLRDMLQLYGHQVTLAASGEDGLELAAAQPFDLVLTDHRMTGMDGFTFAATLGQRLPHLPVVMITGFGDPAAAHALRSAVREILQKPVDLATLRQLVARYTQPPDTTD